MQIVNENSQTSHVPQAARAARLKAFHIWRINKDKSVTELAKMLGITQSTLSIHLRNETMPTEHYKTLVAAGVPANVLPAPLDIPPGPKPKNPASVGAN